MNGSLTNTRWSIVERSIMLVTPSSEAPYSRGAPWKLVISRSSLGGRLRTRDHETSRLSLSLSLSLLFRGHNYETLITRWMHPRHRRAASLESGELSRVMRQPLRYTRWCRFVRVRSFISSHECCCSGSSSDATDNMDRICLIAPYSNPTINGILSRERECRLSSFSPLHERNLLGFISFLLHALFIIREGGGV